MIPAAQEGYLNFAVHSEMYAVNSESSLNHSFFQV